MRCRRASHDEPTPMRRACATRFHFTPMFADAAFRCRVDTAPHAAAPDAIVDASSRQRCA